MSENYYYLVSSLPDLVIDNKKIIFNSSTIFNELSSQLSSNDIPLLEIIRYPFDNYNLCNLLQKNNKSFDSRGNFSKGALQKEIKFFDSIPLFMKLFLESYKNKKIDTSNISLEDHLNSYFYNFVTNHEHDFIREWFTFDLNLRNILAALTIRKLNEGKNEKFTSENYIIGENEIVQLIKKSNAPDFSLGGYFPWIDKLVNDKKDNLIEYEKTIDELRWEFLSELTTFSYFHIETILAFCIKLCIVERWQKLDETTGKKKFNKLLSDMKSFYSEKEKNL